MLALARDRPPGNSMILSDPHRQHPQRLPAPGDARNQPKPRDCLSRRPESAGDVEVCGRRCQTAGQERAGKIRPEQGDPRSGLPSGQTRQEPPSFPASRPAREARGRGGSQSGQSRPTAGIQPGNTPGVRRRRMSNLEYQPGSCKNTRLSYPCRHTP